MFISLQTHVWAFKLANIVVETQFWLITLLLLLIYFELWDKK